MTPPNDAIVEEADDLPYELLERLRDRLRPPQWWYEDNDEKEPE